MHSTSPVLGPFVDLPDHARNALLGFSRRRTFDAGQMVCERGEPADELIVIQSGLVAVHARRADGRRLTLALCGREDVLGELALAGVPRRTAAVEALRPTDVLAIDVSKLSALRAATPELDLAVMGVMADTVRRLTDQLMEASLLSQATRFRRVLARLLAHFPDGRIEITHEMLAELLGAPRTTISALLSAEEAAGRIARGRGFVQIKDAEALRTAADRSGD